MEKFFSIDHLGNIVGECTIPTGINPGGNWIAAPVGVSEETHYYLDGHFQEYRIEQVMAKRNRPNENSFWVPQLSVWVDPRTVEEIAEGVWEAIKKQRELTERSGFKWDGSTFDSDLISQQRIQGAAQLATVALINNQPFSINWTLADNSVRTLNADEMIAVGMALGAHINACHQKSRRLKEMIDAATTIEEVEAITWESAG